MGHIAEDIIDGSCCQLCGCYFEHPKGGIYVHDMEVVCFDCFEDLTDDEKESCIKADVKTF